jgi:hypothetical protein
MRLDFPKGSNRVDVFLHSVEDGTFCFRNNVIFSYLEFPTMDKVQKPSDSECRYVYMMMQ